VSRPAKAASLADAAASISADPSTRVTRASGLPQVFLRQAALAAAQVEHVRYRDAGEEIAHRGRLLVAARHVRVAVPQEDLGVRQ